MHQRAADLTPCQGTLLGCGFDSLVGIYTVGGSQSMFLSLTLLSLKSIKNIILGEDFKKLLYFTTIKKSPRDPEEKSDNLKNLINGLNLIQIS